MTTRRHGFLFVDLLVALAAALWGGPAWAQSVCSDGGFGLDLGGRPTDVACDADDIPIRRACHCVIAPEDRRDWGRTAGLVLSMPRRATVESGATVDLDFTLRRKGSTAMTLDLSGGSVVMETEMKRGKATVEPAPCGELTVLPAPIRITLKPGSTARGILS